MSPFKTSIVAALVSASLTGGSLYFFHLRQNQEASHLRAENNRMRSAAYQRHQMLTVANTLNTPASPVVNNSVTAQHREPSTSPKRTNQDYRNEGQSTPVATLQTFAWACDRGDTAAVEKLLCFENKARNKAMAFMDSLSPEVRSQWNSPEAMAATMLTAQSINLPFPAARILETATVVPVNADRITLQLSGTIRESTEYQKTGDGWKYLITEAMVDDYVNRSREAATRR